MFYKERKRYLMVEVLQEIGAQYIGTVHKEGIFYPPPKQHMEKNRLFDLFDGHDMFSQGQQYHS